MEIFVDTSTLFEFYRKEPDTPELQSRFSAARVTQIHLSELTKVEFDSAIWKKFRMGDATREEVLTALALFRKEFKRYHFVATDSLIFTRVRSLLAKYGSEGLRTLDSIQFATALTLTNRTDIFITSDVLLKSFFQTEGLQTEFPIQRLT